ncbi:NADP-dependent succinic semialdehyde dehydrogenase OS=Streptomyces tendae OX=1932 GN=GUR47_29590 PE=4 SV=1 [Streptomyces tendae]
MPIATVNPANGETLRTYEAMGEEEIERRIELAEATFRTYRTTGFYERAGLMRRAADLLEADQKEIGKVITTEMGKPVKQARAEAAKCAKAMRWYADHAAELLADEEPAEADVKDSGASRALVRYRPLGPVLAVMPWNFPLWQVIRFAAPALMAGNVGLLKHASNVPQTALYLEDLFHRAGFPEGCFQTLLIGSAQVDDILRDVAGAGRHPHRQRARGPRGGLHRRGDDQEDRAGAGRQRPVRRHAVRRRRAGRRGGGDRAHAERRPVVHRRQAVHRAHGRVRRLRRALHRGDARAEGRRSDGRGDLRRPALQRARAERPGGAGRRRGARRRDGAVRRRNARTGRAGTTRRPSWRTSPASCASTARRPFGPVATLYRAADLDEAVLIANDTDFGLSSNVWTRDDADVDRFVRDLEAGGVYVNGMTASHPAFPFGGVKRSGYGRELSGHGIREFCNITTVWHGA